MQNSKICEVSMGLPMSLDGLPNKLELKKAVICPSCKKQVKTFKKGPGEKGEGQVLYCGLCNEKIPEKFFASIKENK